MRLRTLLDSLITRFVVAAVLLVIVGGISRYVVISNLLHANMVAVVSAQQEAIASAVAQDLDYKIEERLHAVHVLAAALPLPLLSRPAELRTWLNDRLAPYPLFSNGIVIVDMNGTVIADAPEIPGRVGSSIATNVDFIAAREGRSDIGHPIISRLTNTAILPFAEAIRDGNKVRAVLIAASRLDASGFLDRIQKEKLGKTGGFLLISPRDKLFISATEAKMILKPTPSPGINALHDKAMNGFRGTDVTVNAFGIEEISGIASVPSSGWFVVARIPTEEAIAVLSQTQTLMVRYNLIQILIVCLVVTLLMVWGLRPLYTVTEQARKMTVGLIPLAPLPISRHDEVGRMTAAFNHLLAKLGTIHLQLETAAHHDVLTGLLNRSTLSDCIQSELGRARENGTCLALFFLDLDGFKNVNDSAGHETGDLALIEVAKRLKAVVRQADVVARVGGDEFVVLLTGLHDIEDKTIQRVSNQIINSISQAIMVGDKRYQIGVSVGIATSQGQSTPDELLARADHAMYAAKKNGGNQANERPDNEDILTSRRIKA